MWNPPVTEGGPSVPSYNNIQQVAYVQSQVQPKQNYNLTFQMDDESYALLGTIPEMYRNFIVNYGLKLVAESNLYNDYLRPPEVVNVLADPNTILNSVPTQPVVRQPKQETQPIAQTSVAPVAAAGFSSW